MKAKLCILSLALLPFYANAQFTSGGTTTSGAAGTTVKVSTTQKLICTPDAKGVFSCKMGDGPVESMRAAPPSSGINATLSGPTPIAPIGNPISGQIGTVIPVAGATDTKGKIPAYIAPMKLTLPVGAFYQDQLTASMFANVNFVSWEFVSGPGLPPGMTMDTLNFASYNSNGTHFIIHGETFALGNYSGNIRLTTPSGETGVMPYDLTVVPNIYGIVAAIDEGSSVAAGADYTVRISLSGYGLSVPEAVGIRINGVWSRFPKLIQNTGEQVSAKFKAPASGTVEIKVQVTSMASGVFVASPPVSFTVR